ncbi:hypothetical protein L596_026612 [Steinernema carpocapsae]|uniref:Uncharacterized protein n=1 Tax=Steinernema carpocapsae TaxID=34508 RepID=A0A4U5M1V8_STECR|nr:hypothetical protein L596_026612 [Steinernema carpocapsae]
MKVEEATLISISVHRFKRMEEPRFVFFWPRKVAYDVLKGLFKTKASGNASEAAVWVFYWSHTRKNMLGRPS